MQRTLYIRTFASHTGLSKLLQCAPPLCSMLSRTGPCGTCAIHAMPHLHFHLSMKPGMGSSLEATLPGSSNTAELHSDR